MDRLNWTEYLFLFNAENLQSLIHSQVIEIADRGTAPRLDPVVEVCMDQPHAREDDIKQTEVNAYLGSGQGEETVKGLAQKQGRYGRELTLASTLSRLSAMP
jgi:hypothetical protein